MRDALALGRGKARERLVEQKNPRSARQRQAHVQQALPAIGKRTRLGALDPRQSQKTHKLRRALRYAVDAERIGPTIAMRRIACLHGEAQILLDGQTGE